MTIDFGDTSHRRFNPLTGEWVLVSPHRMKRPWQGKREAIPASGLPAHDPNCYLCAGNLRANGARNPDYAHTFVFDNDFAALAPDAPDARTESGLLIAEGESGVCRVLCFSPRHDLTIAMMEVADIERVVDAWVEETITLGGRPDIAAVQIFENRGEIMGCSNPHPHGQIWATRHLPNEMEKETHAQAQYLIAHGRPLLVDYLAQELALKRTDRGGERAFRHARAVLGDLAVRDDDPAPPAHRRLRRTDGRGEGLRSPPRSPTSPAATTGCSTCRFPIRWAFTRSRPTAPSTPNGRCTPISTRRSCARRR